MQIYAHKCDKKVKNAKFGLLVSKGLRDIAGLVSAFDVDVGGDAVTTGAEDK